MFSRGASPKDVVLIDLDHGLVPSDYKLYLWKFGRNRLEDCSNSLCLLGSDRCVKLRWSLKSFGGGRAARVHNKSVRMGLGKSVALFQMRDLFWIFLAFEFCHDLEPVGHLFPVALFDSGEVGLAR